MHIPIGFLFIIGIIIYIIGFYSYRFHFPTESDYSYHKSPWWQLYYTSKYLSPIKGEPFGSGLKNHFRKSMAPDKNRIPLIDSGTITIKAVGDLMFRRDLDEKTGKNLWDDVGEYVFDADLTVANLEFAVNPDWVIKKTVRFSVPPTYAEPLLGDERFGKFQVVSLANNHINDSLTGGIQNTCKYIDKKGITRTGAHLNREEQDQFPIIECKGVRIAILSYTFSTNGVPLAPDYTFGTNLIRFNALDENDYDPSLIHHHIALAKERGAELIVACNHWGVEFEYYPPTRLVKRAHALLDAGIDCIIGHHPHIINPLERYRTKDGRSALVLYSLGNVTAWALPLPVQKMSEIAKIEIETGTDPQSGRKTARIGKVTLTPVVHSINKTVRGVRHRILPVYAFMQQIRESRAPEYLTSKDKRLIKAAFIEHKLYFSQAGVTYS